MYIGGAGRAGAGVSAAGRREGTRTGGTSWTCSSDASESVRVDYVVERRCDFENVSRNRYPHLRIVLGEPVGDAVLTLAGSTSSSSSLSSSPRSGTSITPALSSIPSSLNSRPSRPTPRSPRCGRTPRRKKMMHGNTWMFSLVTKKGASGACTLTNLVLKYFFARMLRCLSTMRSLELLVIKVAHHLEGSGHLGEELFLVDVRVARDPCAPSPGASPAPLSSAVFSPCAARAARGRPRGPRDRTGWARRSPRQPSALTSFM